MATFIQWNIRSIQANREELQVLFCDFNPSASVITQGKIPPESFFPHISKLCMKEWQDSWDSTPTNKLFSIKPVLGKNKPHTSLCRRDETVLTRIRIGHSRITHSYLLSRENQPICDHCKCVFTVKHILLECPSTAVVRHKYFSSTT